MKHYQRKDQGFTRPGYEASGADIAYTAQGFNLIGTGGNCTAFHKELAGGLHILVTVHDDAQAPQEAAEPVTVGLYGSEHSEPLDEFEAPDSDAVHYQFLTRYAHWLTPLVYTFGDEWSALCDADKFNILCDYRDAAVSGDDAAFYRKNIGTGNLQSYAKCIRGNK